MSDLSRFSGVLVVGFSGFGRGLRVENKTRLFIGTVFKIVDLMVIVS